MPSPRLLLAAVLSIALSGCVSLGPKVPATLITITPDAVAPAGTTASGKLADALIVSEPETDRRLAVQRVAVQIDTTNVAYLKDAMFVERPSRLFRNLLVETLRAKGGRLVFDDTQTVANNGVRLSGQLREFGYDAASAAVLVRYDAMQERVGGTVTTRRFEASVPVAKAEAELIGPALNEAANKVAKDVADWVG